jgi:hypothetical protein
MVASFGNLALFGIIPFLPVSSELQAGIAVIGWAMSWLLFVIGSLLAGNEGYSHLKQLFRNGFRKPDAVSATERSPTIRNLLEGK